MRLVEVASGTGGYAHRGPVNAKLPATPGISKGGRPRRDHWAWVTGQRTLPTVGTPYREQMRPRCHRAGIWTYWVCPACGKLHRKEQECTRLDCATCEQKVRNRRGQRSYRAYGGAGIGAFVLTLPRQWSGLLGVEQVRELRRLAVSTVIGFYRASYDVSVGVAASVHPTGDRCAQCGDKDAGFATLGGCRRCGAPAPWAPHFHLRVPLRGLREDGSVVELVKFHRSPHLKALRLAWGCILGEVAARLGVDSVDANVHYSYFEAWDAAKVVHRIEYDERPFPAWSAGTFPIGLAVTAKYGILSPNSKHAGVDEWREAIEGIGDEPDPLTCLACGEELEFFDIAHEWSWKNAELEHFAEWLPVSGSE